MTTTRRAIHTPASLNLADRSREFQAVLEQQRQFRLDQLSELAEAAVNSPPAVDDAHDQVNEILRTSAMTALIEVEHALDRLRANTYGICERCTQCISYERLEILPMSRYCMRCSTPSRRHRPIRPARLQAPHGGQPSPAH
jgi:DnaK suppressor protein